MRLRVRPLAGLLLVLSTLAGALVLIAGPVAASCTEPSVDFRDTRDVAFSGVVTKRSQSGDDLITTLRVDRVFKGDVTRRVDVVSPAEEVDLTMTAPIEEQAIVFADVVDNEVTSSLCMTVVGPGKFYRDILADLGEGTEPSAGYMKAERRGFGLAFEEFSAGRAILGTLGLIGLGYFAFRAWRSRRTSG